MIDIFTLPLFEKRLKYYNKKNPLLKKDFAKLLDLLEINPEPTTAIPLKENVYKIRMANASANKGKSVGYRVYYFYKNRQGTLLLFYMHSKSDESNINDVRLDRLIRECEIFLKEIEK